MSIYLKSKLVSMTRRNINVDMTQCLTIKSMYVTHAYDLLLTMFNINNSRNELFVVYYCFYLSYQQNNITESKTNDLRHS
jgi:hypothetical protein